MFELSILLIISILAFVNTAFLYYQHWRKEVMKKGMVCPIGFDCEAVVGSKYGKIFGMSNEILGMLYYLFLSGLIIAWMFSLSIEMISFVVLIVSVATALFSTYLLGLQIFVIKKFCFWCLIAIGLNYAFLIAEYFFFYM